MALKVTKIEMWTASVSDRAGGAADKLEALAKAGANLEMVFGRRTPENPGQGIMFVAPVKGAMHALGSALRTAKRLQYNKTAAARVSRGG